jgi:hypothetical protein
MYYALVQYYIFIITSLTRVLTFGPLDFVFTAIGEVAATVVDERLAK